ncbi:MAG: biotin carboxylase, partial [Dehalococcoidia bacterium]
DYRFKGADLGVVVTKGRLQTDEPQLTERCHRIIDGVRAQYASSPVDEPAQPVPISYVKGSSYG